MIKVQESVDKSTNLTSLFSQVIMAVCVAATVSSVAAWGVSSQFQKQDGHGNYAYGYEDPNSQKQEQRSAHGVVHGGYSYVDGAGKVQHVKYVADPKAGFHIVGASNLPEAPQAGAGVPNDGRFGFDHAQIVIGHGGVPVDTPEVQHARAKHLAALSQAHQNASPYGHNERRRRSLPSAPIDTPEVQHARAAHFAAFNHAASGHEQGYNTGSIKHVVIPFHGPLHHPALHKGVPVDTPEVIQARQKHFNAWGAASQSGGDDEGQDGGDEGGQQGGNQGQNWGGNQGQNWGGNQGGWGGNQGAWAGNQGGWAGNQGGQGGNSGAGVSQGDYYRQAPVAEASSGYKGPIHVPVIQQGVPVETPEVQHARAAHLTALAKAHAEAGPYAEPEQENEKWN